MSAYTHVNLKQDVEDQAPSFGIEGVEARFAAGALGCEKIGLSYQRIDPDQPHPFAHRHEESEELYVVTGGSGVMRVGDDEIELKPFDAVRVAPATVRAFRSGPDGLELLAFGTRNEGDGEILPSPWADAKSQSSS
jgi:mannose-6-phosphate isomerase-like protein (cupin superfamily)